MVENSASEMFFVDSGGNPDVSRGELGAERMMGLVEPPAIGIVAELLDHRKAELQLLRLAERTMQAAVAGNGLIGNGAHDRYQFAPESGKERADRLLSSCLPRRHRSEGRRHADRAQKSQRIRD